MKGRIMHMEPTTQLTMKEAAPNNSPTAKLPVLLRIAEKVENKSGLPFPNARNVTPATLSSSPRVWATVARFGQKKSEALMPIVEKRNMSQTMRPAKVHGRAAGSAQKYRWIYGIERKESDSGHSSLTCLH